MVSIHACWPTRSWSREGMAGYPGRRREKLHYLAGNRQGADEDLGAGFATQAQARATDAQDAWAALAEHLKPASGAQAEFGHAADPGGRAQHLFNFCPFTCLNQVQR